MANTNEGVAPVFFAALGGGIGLGITITLILGVLFAPNTPGGIPVCEQEDAREQEVCYWDAEKQGNGIGQSFISTDHGRVIFYPSK